MEWFPESGLRRRFRLDERERATSDVSHRAEPGIKIEAARLAMQHGRIDMSSVLA